MNAFKDPEMMKLTRQADEKQFLIRKDTVTKIWPVLYENPVSKEEFWYTAIYDINCKNEEEAIIVLESFDEVIDLWISEPPKNDLGEVKTVQKTTPTPVKFLGQI